MAMVSKKYASRLLQLSLLTIFFAAVQQLHAEVGTLAGESPGEGFGPDLLADPNGDGILAFVAPKGGVCERLVITPTQAAINDEIKIVFVFNPRLVTNHKWDSKKEEEIWSGPFNKITTIFYNHMGHRGVHGGATARDTNNHAGIRFERHGKRISDDFNTWKKYFRIALSSFRPEMEGVFNGEQTEGKAYMDPKEANQLIAWGMLDKEFADTLAMVDDEIERLEAIEAGEIAGTESVSAIVASALDEVGLGLVKKGGQWILEGVKKFIVTPTGCGASQSNVISSTDRINATLAKK